MKRIVAVVLLALLSAPMAALAIPQTISGILQGPGGENITLEEWLREAKHWLADAELPGKWTPLSTDASKLETSNPGSVFGVSASSAVAVKDASGAVKQVVVHFDAGKAGRAALLTRLTNSIAVFQNSKKWEKVANGMTNTGSELSVLLAQNAASGDVTATITRAVP